MAIDRTPVLKRCRSLGLTPAFLGISKESHRQAKRANRKKSEYGIQLTEKQKAKFIYGLLEKQFRGYYDRAKKWKASPVKTCSSFWKEELTTLYSVLVLQTPAVRLVRL